MTNCNTTWRKTELRFVCIQGFGHSRVRLPAKREKECLSLKSAKPPPRPCVRADIAFAIGSPSVEISKVTVHLHALNRYKGTKAHFVDCLIAASAVAKDVPVATFDQDFRKFADVRVETE